MAVSIDTATGNQSLLDVDEIIRKAELHDRRLTALKVATSSFLRRDARLAQLRERTLLLRSRAKWAWKNCHEYRRFVQESQQKFNDEAAAVLTSPIVEGFADRLEALKSCHEQVTRDFQEQNKLAESANALQTELGVLEYELQTKEASARESAEMVKKLLDEIVLPGHSGTATVAETDVPPSPSIQSSNVLNALVEHYFSKVGVVRDVLEQQMELEADYNEAKGERDFQAEHDQALDTSDEDFETYWWQKLNQMALNLSEVKRVADSALDTCLNEGLNPEDYRRRPQRGSDRSVPDSVGDEISRIIPPITDFHETGFGHTRSSSDDGQNRIQILTPESGPIRTSRPLGPPAERQTQPPLQDRVLSWMRQLESQEVFHYFEGKGAQRPDLIPRRSISLSGPLGHASRLHMFGAQNEVAGQLEQASPADFDTRRRRYSDSSPGTRLSRHLAPLALP